jgi:hypothetical protein
MAVEPGKAAEFSIQLDTRGLEGELFKTVTVTSNERLSPIQTLSLRGVVEQPLQVSPPFLSISFPPEQSANATGTVRVINRTAHPVTLSEPTTSSGSFKATLQTLKSGQEFEVGVTGVPPFPPGNTAGIVSLKTSWTNLPVLTITVVARVQPALEADPWELVLPRQITSWTTNLVTITNNANRAVALFDPQVSDPRARVELKTIIPGRSFLLAAAFPPGFELAPGQSVQLSINSDNPSRPLLTVWVRQDSAVPAPPQVRPRIHIKPQPAGQ